ncbi:hypothetical protein IAR50_007032 [Cryptococcus sp. DSM 104548]
MPFFPGVVADDSMDGPAAPTAPAAPGMPYDEMDGWMDGRARKSGSLGAWNKAARQASNLLDEDRIPEEGTSSRGPRGQRFQNDSSD